MAKAPRVVREGGAVFLSEGTQYGMHVSTFKCASAVQGYLAQNKMLPLRALRWAYVEGPTVALGGGRCFS